ncbi:hypothetical protein [Nannocystis exedens]|nr:hypothetical protein [Nannocystis exedens]
MSNLAQFMDKSLFLTLSDEQVERLTAVVDAELASNPDVQLQIKKVLEQYVPLKP